MASKSELCLEHAVYSAVNRSFSTMLFVSESARDRILEILRKDGKDPLGHFVRVTVTSGGCSGLSYHMDISNEEKPNDQIFEDKGIRLVTDLKSFLYLHNTTLDFSGGLEGKGFYFVNPNASRTCACGESFSL
jgi:iron-sulfur cluster assembly protein